MNPELEAKVIETIKTVYDPEIPVNIYELGLIYKVEASDEGKVEITMTLTSPNCPMVDDLLDEIHEKTIALQGVNDFKLNVVFDPPWTRDMMSDEARLELGLM
jgi:FeS assembly SUF system protein